jgi:hypothetical protein
MFAYKVRRKRQRFAYKVAFQGKGSLIGLHFFEHLTFQAT